MTKPKFKIIPAVLGLAVRKNGKKQLEYLLTKRHAPDNPRIDKKWQLPGGGLEFGENPEEALVREMQEEVGVTPTILYPHPIVITNIWGMEHSDIGMPIQVLLMVYIVDIGEQTPEIVDPDEETSDMGWFTYQDVRQMPFLPKMMETLDAAEKIIQETRLF